MTSPKTGPFRRLARDTTVLLRILRFAAYEARSRNTTLDGLPASITYMTEEASRGEAVA